MSTNRIPEFPVDDMFIQRWSTRSFRNAEIPEDDIRSMFEAVRWAPSSMNEQPWRVIFAVDPSDRNVFLDTLMDGNKSWAAAAPLLIYFASRRRFTQRDRINGHAAFDTGAAWMSLALQAHRLGYHTHAMGGFHADKAYATLGMNPQDYELLACVAVGRRAEPTHLSEDLQKRESPNSRRKSVEFVFEGRMDE